MSTPNVPWTWDYTQLCDLLREERLPAMLVELELLDFNLATIRSQLETSSKTLRVATKSVRVPWLLHYILQQGGPHFRGLMTYSVDETAYLASQGFDDFLIAYPTVQAPDLQQIFELNQTDVQLTIMLDSLESIEEYERFWSHQTDPKPLQICLDVDMSYRWMGQHIGVQRSPLRTLQAIRPLFKRLQTTQHLRLYGLMGYEAQIAGLGDQSPFSAWMNPIKRWLKRKSHSDLLHRRKALRQEAKQHHFEIQLFNGGGTGSLRTSIQDPSLTEVTVGSGFLQSQLFDYYQGNTNLPACCFALQVTRRPQSNVVTCQSGGFQASGEAHPDKAPTPFLPKGLHPFPLEGFGEVQTPLQHPPELSIPLGSPLFFRPAKAGEIAERFQEYLLLRRGKLLERVPTYRGDGRCFF